jgi:hypothetical protein
VKQLSGENIVDFSTLKVKKLNKTTRGIVGNIIIKAADVDNSLQVALQFWTKQGGEFRQLPYKLPPKNLCDFLNEDTMFIPGLVEVSNIPYPMPCPVPQVKIQIIFSSKLIILFQSQENYSIFGYTPTLKDLPTLHLLSSGDYKAEFNILKKNKQVLVFEIQASLVNLKK